METKLQAEYELKHKQAEVDRRLKREALDAELEDKAKAQELDIKYQESLLEIETRRQKYQLQSQQRQATTQANLTNQIANESIRILEEERVNIKERSNEGYLAAELYSKMTQAGFGGGGGYPSRTTLPSPA